MDDMELDGTPSKQPEDPFKGDAAVTAEKPEDPFGGDEAVAAEQPAPAQAEQVEQAEPVTAEAQPQPAAEAAAEEKPKWIKIVELVSVICITAAGFIAALFMCLISISAMNVNLMLKDVAENINNAVDALDGATSFEGLGTYVTAMFTNAYLLLGMVTGIVAGLVCGIILIVKVVKKFALKKPTTLEKTAITSCLFFFAVSVMVLNLAMVYSKFLGVEMGTKYGGATLAGLILCGILFAAYFICKVAVNYKSYLGDKTKLINGCMNLGWTVVAVVVLAVLSCAPVYLTSSVSGIKINIGMGFNQIFSEAIGRMLDYGTADKIPQAVAESLATQYVWGAVGMVIQIWFIFQTGKSLHGAMRGTVEGDKTVKLGSQIWRVVFAVLYLIVTIIIAKEYAVTAADDFAYGSGGMEAVFNPSYAAPIVILIFSVIGLVLAIVNKILVKEQANKKEI